MVGKYEYKELREAAIAFNATEQELKNMGEWFTAFGSAYWNGECYDMDGYTLWPVYEYDEENDQSKITGWEVRR